MAEPPWDGSRPEPRLFDTDAQVVRIGLGLLDRSLPKPDWTHEGHFAATLFLLARRPELDLASAMPGLIRAYNLATGGVNTDHAGYHETITLASIGAARGFTSLAVSDGLAAAVNALLVSPFGRPDWLFAYWSRACLLSVAARRAWVPPDIRALPFPPG